MTAQLTPADHADIDAFWTAKPARRRPPVSKRTHCRVCERDALAHADCALLCADCGADLEAARRFVGEVMERAMAAADLAWSAMAEGIEGADDTTRARWDTFQDAYTRGDAMAGVAMEKARAGLNGPLADLLRLWGAHLDAQRELTRRQDWRRRADVALLMCDPEPDEVQGEIPL